MVYRIGWLSPLTPASGIGTFSHAVTRHFPESFDGEPVDLTILHLDHRKLYHSKHRCIQIEDTENFHQVLTLFDVLVYNIGNNKEHHDLIFDLLRMHPGIIICHDYVYQHYLAERSLRASNNFSAYGALLTKYGDGSTADYLKRSRITSRIGNVRYSPWDSEYSVQQPMSDAILDLGSAIIVHSEFAERQVRRTFSGPVLRLGMPHDQKRIEEVVDLDAWERVIAQKRSFHLVSFGHIQPTKCIDLTIAAIAASKTLRRKLRYTVAGFVGDPVYLQQLRGMVASLSLRDIVIFETEVSDSRLADLMHEADIFINLRKPNTEGSSASLIEQLDVGKPVIVLDTGCYAEIGARAAIKLPPDAGGIEIQNALERLIAKPEQMPAIGRAGRAHARSWTCASYANAFARFTFEHREILQQRARVTAVRSEFDLSLVDVEDDWVGALARARASLRYLDRNMLAFDPDIVMTKSRDELCTYVAHVIFGIFNNSRLQHCLSRFFACREEQAVYWACVKFALIVEAVFDGQDIARQRLLNMEPCYDPEFWDVIENFPSEQHLAAAALLLQICPGADEETPSDLAEDGFSKRRRIIEIVRRAPPDLGGALDQLRIWLEQPSEPDRDHASPVIDRDLVLDVGSDAFRETVDLSGFYNMEPDLVWVRGQRGFVGLRLGTEVAHVEFLVRQIHASPSQPCIVRVSSGRLGAELEVVDEDPHWIALDIGREGVGPAAVLWLQIFTSHAAPPPNSSDARPLGVCLMGLRFATAQHSRMLQEA